MSNLLVFILSYFILVMKPHVSTDVVLLFYLLVLSSGMENRTLSQMYGSFHLPIFLFRVGLLTLIYMASSIAPAMPDW